jgi:hypothetical protein
LQTGRPVVAISRLPKTRRFLEEHDLARYRLVESQPEKVGPLLDDICANRDSLLSRIIELRSSLHNQAQEHARRAYDQLLDAAAALPPPTRRWRNRVRKLLDFGSYF